MSNTSTEWLRLRDLAKKLGIKVGPWWSVDTLRRKIEEVQKKK